MSAHEFGIIGITETWLKVNSPTTLVNKNNYTFIEKHRSDIINKDGGGGVGMYIKDNIQFILRENFSIMEEYIETIFIEIPIQKGRNKIVGTIYRPPDSDNKQFIEALSRILDTIQKENKTAYLMGDFNIDLQQQKCCHTKDFINLLNTYFYYPTITKPTRITESTATVIDNIFCNNINRNISKTHVGIFVTDISDHLPIFLLEKQQTYQKQFEQEKFKCRDYCQVNIETFKRSMSEVDWSIVTDIQSCEHAYNKFHDICTTIFEQSFPMKESKKYKHNPTKPWLTSGLIAACHTKHQLYLTFIKCQTNYNEIQFKKYRNKLDQIIKTAKKTYYHKKFEQSKNDIKETWKTIKSLLNKTNTAQQTQFLHKNKVITDKFEIANGFNDYFVNIGPELSTKIQSTSK
jgi:hypothetical protein